MDDTEIKADTVETKERDRAEYLKKYRSEHREETNEYVRKRRAKAREDGMCCVHTKIKAVEGTAFCGKCIEKANLKREQFKELGVCGKHPTLPVVPGFSICCICMDTNQKNSRKTVLDGKANGMCIHHRYRKAQVRNVCEECWFRDMGYKALGVTTLWGETKKILEDQNYLCNYTGVKLVPGENASIDHIIPRSKGGKLELNNLQWVDSLVNFSKKNMLPELFLETMGLVVKRFNLNGN